MRAYPKPYKIVVDTGPLFDYLAFQFSSNIKRIEGLNKKILHLKSRDSIEGFKSFIDSSKGLLSIPGVIVEIGNHLRKTGIEREKFWEYSRKNLRNINLSEQLIKVSEMNLAELANFGPVDASLIQLLRDNENAILLTSDSKLHGKCKKLGLGVKFTPEILKSE